MIEGSPRCAYAELVSGQQVHYRVLGTGAPVLLLHPSPQSSAALLPVMQAFSGVATCIAPDTPGYGLSDPLSSDAQSLDDYARVMIEFADALGLDRFHVYGAATGGQIAIAMAKAFPTRIRSVLLDSIGHFDEAEQDRMLDGYFPEVTPRRDGGHLLTYWEMVRHLYLSFPWQSLRTEDQLAIDAPDAAAMQTLVLRYLESGEHYASAYRIAFAAEKNEFLGDLNVPGTLMRWRGSLVGRYTETLIDMGLPDNIRVLDAGLPVAERFSLQADALARACETDDPVSLPVDRLTFSDELRCTYIGHPERPLHARVRGANEGRPLVVLHDNGESSRRACTRANPHVSNRPVIWIDLPGHGATPWPKFSDATAFADGVQWLAEALNSAGLSDIECQGYGLGGAWALALAHKLPLARVIVTDPIPYSVDEQAAFKAQGLNDLEPRPDGTHLLRAWYQVRESARSWPWFDPRAAARRPELECVDLAEWHARTVELLVSARVFPALQRSAIAHDWTGRLKRCPAAVQVEVSSSHPCSERLENWAHVARV